MDFRKWYLNIEYLDGDSREPWVLIITTLFVSKFCQLFLKDCFEITWFLRIKHWMKPEDYQLTLQLDNNSIHSSSKMEESIFFHLEIFNNFTNEFFTKKFSTFFNRSGKKRSALKSVWNFTRVTNEPKTFITHFKNSSKKFPPKQKVRTTKTRCEHVGDNT